MYVLVNGSPTDEFKLRRELRHGDLLALFFLFLVVAKGLSDLMTEAVKKGFYLGVKLGKRLRV